MLLCCRGSKGRVGEALHEVHRSGLATGEEVARKVGGEGNEEKDRRRREAGWCEERGAGEG